MTPSCWGWVLMNTKSMLVEYGSCHSRIELQSFVVTIGDCARQDDGRHDLHRRHDAACRLDHSRSWADIVLTGENLAGVLNESSAQSDSEKDLIVVNLEEASTELDREIVLTEEVLEAVPVEEVLDDILTEDCPGDVFDEVGRKGDDLAKDVLDDDLAEDGLRVALNEGVLKDVLADGELVIVPAEDVLDGEPTEDGLGVVVDEEVLVDVLAEGGCVDVPAEDVLAPLSR